MMNYLVQAIRKLKPNSEFSFTNDDYSTVKWDVLDGKAPTFAEIEAAIKEVEAEIKAEAATKNATKQAVLDKLGLSADEVAALLG